MTRCVYFQNNQIISMDCNY